MQEMFLVTTTLAWAITTVIHAENPTRRSGWVWWAATGGVLVAWGVLLWA